MGIQTGDTTLNTLLLADDQVIIATVLDDVFNKMHKLQEQLTEYYLETEHMVIGDRE